MLPRVKTYEELQKAFHWEIPERYNIGVDICDRWAERVPDAPAIIDAKPDGTATTTTFGELRARSNQLAHALAARGVGRHGEVGDRIGVLLPQCVETALAHIASAKLGCVSIPLFTLFGVDALGHRLRDSGARAVITNRAGAARIAEIRAALPELEVVLCIDGAVEGAEDFSTACEGERVTFEPVDTLADDPAVLIYTSGTTGDPKGALHAHRVLLGHLPGVEVSHNLMPEDGDRFWTPADWAWIGGLLDVLMPALHHGIPVVACRFEKFTGEAALRLMAAQEVRNAFLPPTALKMMRLVPDADRFALTLRSVASGGETLSPELIDWGERVFGTTINEFYGQTECNMVVSSCSALEAVTPGVMGRAAPGHRVEVIDEVSGAILADGEEGAIAVLSPDPVMFLRYWNNPEATAEKFVDGPDGRWLLTGDRGTRDAGRFTFVGRNDDVISSAGYRIGPAEVENCLISHPAVQLAGVVGKPDPIRGAVVAAYVTLAEGYEPSDRLADEIAQHVKNRLAAHEYPRRVYFLSEMPLTTTGKIIRARLRDLAAGED
ncbi:AMP-dependent synthetase [Acuticoccus sediminis]|uniref:AMP-dependent synthetase n=1 Tax=Acuticoccus sediminis TaxID=2184697 RepID=A0A8B2NJU5_9HYPH|nr:AMP-binding protein [Acuticoccus sediminis]RAH99745.1 AMP-dependent synthetase [Acuticoccus sediminis]